MLRSAPAAIGPWLPLQGADAAAAAASCCILLIIVGLATRLRTGCAARSQARAAADPSGGAPAPAKPPPMVPYWLPLLGHLPDLALSRGAFLPRLRDSLPHGVASLNLLGTTHVFIFRHSVGGSLLAKAASAADAGWVRARVVTNGFGCPPADLDSFMAMAPRINDLYTRSLLSGPGLARMVANTAERLARNIDRFVTLGAAGEKAARAPWELMAGARPATAATAKERRDGEVDQGSSDEASVEVSLDELVRAFVGFNANPAVLGEDFFENFPDFLAQLWEFNKYWSLLVTGVPRWVPSLFGFGGGFTRALAARAEMLRAMRQLQAALDRQAAGEDPGPGWRRLNTVSDLMHARAALYRERGIGAEARAANELGFAWARNVNSNMLVFWMVAHVAADPELLAGVRAEVAAHMGGGGGGGRVDVEGLCARCPLLKAAYVESLRLDSSSWGFRQAREDLVLADRDRDGATVARWLVPKGAYAHVAEEMHHTDPAIFPDPFTWDHRRHITDEPVAPASADADGPANKKKKVPVATMGLVRPYGGGSFSCPGRRLALYETMAFAAAILHQYDICPVNTNPDGSWVMPVAAPSSIGVKELKAPFRVVVKRRRFQ